MNDNILVNTQILEMQMNKFGNSDLIYNLTTINVRICFKPELYQKVTYLQKWWGENKEKYEKQQPSTIPKLQKYPSFHV